MKSELVRCQNCSKEFYKAYKEIKRYPNHYCSHSCVILCDEIITPDNSRFYPIETYKVGRNEMHLDKQLVRNYLNNCGWNKIDSAPQLPAHIIDEVSLAYQHVYYLLLGKTV